MALGDKTLSFKDRWENGDASKLLWAICTETICGTNCCYASTAVGQLSVSLYLQRSQRDDADTVENAAYVTSLQRHMFRGLLSCTNLQLTTVFRGESFFSFWIKNGAKELIVLLLETLVHFWG
jgi:hypothetical protein